MGIPLSNLYTYPTIPPVKGLYGRIPVVCKSTLIGVEVELEKVSWRPGCGNTPNSFSTIEDGSLKIEGSEFVTEPTPLGFLEVELQRIFSGINEPLLSSRCSTHVHLDVRDMTKEQLNVLLLLYSLYERSFFKVSGNRYNNIFCVPLYECHGFLTHFLTTSMKDITWKKYTALNVSPIFGGESKKALGTIEFRQHKGTKNIEEIINWCNLIVSLKKASMTMDITEVLYLLKNPMKIFTITKTIFSDWEHLFTSDLNFLSDFEVCLRKVKEAVVLSGMVQKTMTLKEEV